MTLCSLDTHSFKLTQTLQIQHGKPRQRQGHHSNSYLLGYCRQQYAGLVPASAAEGILGSQKGELLEGFVSNLFIVQNSDHGLVVRTALKGVLAGTKQNQVLAACKALNIQIECKAPMRTERHLWKEAFLTNAVRGLRPISSISCPSNNAVGWEPWECQLPVHGSQTVYSRVQKHLTTTTRLESV